MKPTETQKEIDAIMASPTASFWLKRALAELSSRNIVDATCDARKLARLMDALCNEEFAAFMPEEGR